jgi:hypothetical protein
MDKILGKQEIASEEVEKGEAGPDWILRPEESHDGFCFDIWGGV